MVLLRLRSASLIALSHIFELLIGACILPGPVWGTLSFRKVHWAKPFRFLLRNKFLILSHGSYRWWLRIFEIMSSCNTIWHKTMELAAISFLVWSWKHVENDLKNCDVYFKIYYSMKWYVLTIIRPYYLVFLPNILYILFFTQVWTSFKIRGFSTTYLSHLWMALLNLAGQPLHKRQPHVRETHGTTTNAVLEGIVIRYMWHPLTEQYDALIPFYYRQWNQNTSDCFVDKMIDYVITF